MSDNGGAPVTLHSDSNLEPSDSNRKGDHRSCVGGVAAGRVDGEGVLFRLVGMVWTSRLSELADWLRIQTTGTLIGGEELKRPSFQVVLDGGLFVLAILRPDGLRELQIRTRSAVSAVDQAVILIVLAHSESGGSRGF